MHLLDTNWAVDMHPKRKWGGGDESLTASREESAHSSTQRADGSCAIASKLAAI